jgi:hypothetical protein
VVHGTITAEADAASIREITATATAATALRHFRIHAPRVVEHSTIVHAPPRTRDHLVCQLMQRPTYPAFFFLKAV